MRPGQAAPEFQSPLRTDRGAKKSFNEAGAGCPGILAFANHIPILPESFNEAGAGCPGILEIGIRKKQEGS